MREKERSSICAANHLSVPSISHSLSPAPLPPTSRFALKSTAGSTMEGNIYRTSGRDCFTNGSLGLLADEQYFSSFPSHSPFSLSSHFCLLAFATFARHAFFTDRGGCRSDKRILQNESSLTHILSKVGRGVLSRVHYRRDPTH